MFRSILLTRSLLKFNFSKYIINESNFESLRKQFAQKPQTSTFGSYFNYDNAMPIFSIVSSAKHLQRTHRIAVLNQLQAMCENEQSHKANSDQGLNLLANIHFHKATELTSMGNFQLTVKQLQAAIAIIEIMQHPDYFFLGELHRSRGEAYLRMNDMSKSQNALLKAESYLKQLLDDLLEQDTEQSNNNKQAKQQLKTEISKTRVALSHTLTQLANTLIKQSKVYQSKSQMQKALQTWQYVTNFKGIPYYELTIRLKCILHVIFNERNDALESSNQLLEYLEDPKTHKHYRNQQQLNLAKIWHMNFIVSNYKEESKSMYEAMKEKWEKRLIQLIKESKETFKPQQFQNIMKSTGLTQEKLAKYGLV